RLGSPLHYASAHNQPEAAILLASAGADLEARCRCRCGPAADTPLAVACSRGHCRVAEVLLAFGAARASADVDWPSASGRVDGRHGCGAAAGAADCAARLPLPGTAGLALAGVAGCCLACAQLLSGLCSAAVWPVLSLCLACTQLLSAVLSCCLACAQLLSGLYSAAVWPSKSKSGQSHRGGQTAADSTMSPLWLPSVTLESECPGIAALLSRPAVRPEDIDRLQWEAETLLANVNKRSFLLAAEISGTPLPGGLITRSNKNQNGCRERPWSIPGKPLALTISLKRRREDSTSADGAAAAADASASPLSADEVLAPPAKRAAAAAAVAAFPGNNKPLRPGGVYQQRKNKAAAVAAAAASAPAGASANSDSAAESATPQQQADAPPGLYEVPNKFWALMEPYCAEITEDNLHSLELLIRSADSGAGADAGGLGPLAQQLVAALVANDDEDSGVCKSETLTDTDDPGLMQQTAQLAALPTKQLAKLLGVSNSCKLERRLRKQLERHGVSPGRLAAAGAASGAASAGGAGAESDSEGAVAAAAAAEAAAAAAAAAAQLTSSSSASADPDDEVATALRGRQRELRRLCDFNRATLRRLYAAAKLDTQRQAIRRRLAVADADVVEAHARLQAYRQKRRQPLKKDRDAAWKALRERAKIVRELEAFETRHKALL
uniref:ANK_REP_REGION domain-containing protein n=1 Tax=Macrostomum lignano TaxID=282301 RepID=A0A1I8IVG2_9PLAT